MIDTSAFVAAIVVDHEHHELTRPYLIADMVIPAIVLAETYAQLTRTVRQSAEVAAAVLGPWVESERVLGTSPAALAQVLRRAVELDLGGNVYDALIAQVCLEHKAGLITLNRRQHALALALGVDSSFLLA